LLLLSFLALFHDKQHAVSPWNGVDPSSDQRIGRLFTGSSLSFKIILGSASAVELRGVEKSSVKDQ
jgi:hypothetical protein